MDDVDDSEAAPLTVWLGLLFTAAVSFWAQATVTEERFVPALNVIASRLNIPDDVAGATLMAAGASSPELFSSIVSLFVTHSALGLGTIVGSEIFNQLIICAGSVVAARSGTLQLDRAVVMREVCFYGLSVGLLYVALSDRRSLNNDPDGPDIHIHFVDAVILFGAYVVYVLVLAYFEQMRSCFSGECAGDLKSAGAGGGGSYGSLGEGSNRFRSTKCVAMDMMSPMPFLLTPRMSLLKQTKYGPAQNFHPKSQKDLMARSNGKSIVGLYRTESGGDHRIKDADASRSSQGQRRSASASPGPSRLGRVGDSPRSASPGDRRLSFAESFGSVLENFSDGASARYFNFVADSEKPSERHGLYDIERNEEEGRLSCFMWQQNFFYSKTLAMKGWQLRWITFTRDNAVSVPDRFHSNLYELTYPRFSEIQVDDDRLIVRLVNPLAGKRDYYLMAPTRQIFETVLEKMEKLVERWEEVNPKEGGDQDLKKDSKVTKSPPIEIDGIREGASANAEPSLIEFPTRGTFFEIIVYLILVPFKLLMQCSIPDVRKLSPQGDPLVSLTRAFVATLSCLVWLVIGSYAMVASLEGLAFLLNIPNAVIGVTVSAAGTSLPNYVASQCAAKQGFGNMAVSNAFGSNTFNIMVGLGLPWTIYTALLPRGEDYHGLKDDGITISVIILAGVLLSFVILMLLSNFVLYRWHAHLFFGMYAAYILYAVGQVFL